MIFLSQKDLESLGISIADQVAQMRKLFLARADGSVVAAPKAAIETGDGRYLMATLSAADDPPLLAVKSVVVNQDNALQGLPAINGSIMLLDSRSGVPRAFLDGNWITAVRTAAASAMVAAYLARDDSSVMAFIGAGVQAQSHLAAFAELYPLRAIRILGRGRANIEKLCERASVLNLEAQVCDDARSAIADADIVVSSIPIASKVEPFADPRWLKPGVFVSSTDMALPWMQDGMTAFDRIVIDDYQQEAAMAQPMVDIDRVSGDLNGLLGGEVAARGSDGERTAFLFRAVALGDLALATLAYQRALETGVGLDVGS
jgi:ornithine cyclodeaminase/alanine dehydrogenase